MVDGFGAGHVHGVQRIGHGLQVPPREVQVKGRVPKVDVTEQQLNGALVGSLFQQMRGIRMPAMSLKT